ncbi:hypothetical protein [Microbulbifer sp. SAOS-129_SWC]|uniref:hypothetical protein n=1 Tax=Microbulbifer sp. SAOS-129_SWC TaxID=3145235 RepID=UPI003216587F
MFIKIPLLAALIAALIQTGNPLVCAAIWAAAVLIFGVIGGGIGWWLLLASGLAFLLALGYFSLLDYLEGSNWWWPALIGGFVVVILFT